MLLLLLLLQHYGAVHGRGRRQWVCVRKGVAQPVHQAAGWCRAALGTWQGQVVQVMQEGRGDGRAAVAALQADQPRLGACGAERLPDGLRNNRSRGAGIATRHTN